MDEGDPGFYDSAMLLKFGAIAYSRAGNFEKAEKLFESALHHELARTGGSWAPNDKKTVALFEAMAGTYFEMQQEEANKNGYAEVDATMEAALGVLCYVSGIHFESYVEGEEYNDMLCVLKPKYYQTKHALKMLKSSVTDPVSVEKFRSTILACVKKRVSRKHNPGMREQRRSAKKEARKLVDKLQGGAEPNAYILTCSNPACGKVERDFKLQFCPCQTVSYVSFVKKCK